MPRMKSCGSYVPPPRLSARRPGDSARYPGSVNRLPAARRFAHTLEGESIAYRSYGTGEPVVLVHGTALSQVIWRGLGYVDALAPDHRVITIDLRGHGQSTIPVTADRYSLERLAGDVLAVLDDAGIPSAHYIGYSLGGLIGFSLVDRLPERIRSFTALAGTFRPADESAERVFFPEPTGVIAAGGMDAFVEEWARAKGESVDAETSRALRRNDPRAMIALLTALEAEKPMDAERLAALRTPSLLIVGDADTACSEPTREAAMRMPDARLVVLAGEDHTSILGASAQVIAEVRRFLRAQRSRPDLT